MANEIRSPSDVLSDMLGAIAASDAGPAVLGALRASVMRRMQLVKSLPQPWTVANALAALFIACWDLFSAPADAQLPPG